jgi:electron transfer flavoprotein beta subunit
LNIIVCMKQTFSTEEKIVVKEKKVSEENVEFIINPYDEYAIEEAVRLKQKFGGEVTVITIGPERSESALRTALAMGADCGMHIVDDSLFGDEYVLSKALSQAIKRKPYDLILAGNFSVDSGAGQVAIRLAEELDIPHVGSVTSLQLNEREVIAERDVEGDTEVVRAELPLLITAQQGLNEPRYPSLPGIMSAKKKPIERLAAIDLSNGELLVSKTIVVEEYAAAKKQSGFILQGDIQNQVKELAELLKNKAKVI